MDFAARMDDYTLQQTFPPKIIIIKIVTVILPVVPSYEQAEVGVLETLQNPERISVLSCMMFQYLAALLKLAYNWL